MNPSVSKRAVSFFTDEDRKRQRREMGYIVALLLMVAGLIYAENRVLSLHETIPISSTILMFILININLLFLVLLIFLVVRNLVKLLYDRRRKTMGARLKTRLVMAFITLTILPTTVLFCFSVTFITASVKFWFDVNVEHALESSLRVGQEIYAQADKTNAFFLEEVSAHVSSRELILPEKREQLSDYLQTAREAYHLQGIEVYGEDFEQVAAFFSEEISNEIHPLSPDQLRKESKEKSVTVVFQQVPSGELLRTIGILPRTPDHTQGYVVVTTLIPLKLSKALASISSGVEGYRQMILLKQPFKHIYFLAFSIVALMVVFSAVWFGFYLAKTISIPIKELAEGTLRVAEGDLDVHIDVVADDEIGSLVDSFNKMAFDLRQNRTALERSAQQLRAQNATIEERRQFMEIVLKHVSAGVISMDTEGRITTISKSAEDMLHLSVDAMLNVSYRDLLTGEQLKLAEEILENLVRSTKGAIETTVRITIGEQPRSFLLHINSLKDGQGHPLGMVLVFDDLTELEKAQRLAAWREVARRIAHEVKNPLTPIALAAQRLDRRYSDRIQESVFTECVQTIIDHVSLIRNLVNEFSTFAKFPSAHLLPGRIDAIIEETVALYREAHPSVRFDLAIPEGLPEINLDRQQMKQAMINLVDNAVSAMKGLGAITISVSTDPILKKVRIEVADTGPGVSDEEKIRLFEPYFSTKQTGMGLGLTIVNSIIADHFGMIRVLDNRPQGARFVIELPMLERCKQE